MLKIVEDPDTPNSAGGSLLDEIVRDGARQMLAAAALLVEAVEASNRFVAEMVEVDVLNLVEPWHQLGERARVLT